MPGSTADLYLDGTPIAGLESDFLSVHIAPAVGGRILSIVHKPTGQEFLWRNQNLRLERLGHGSEYDPNFYGGIDELLPNDIPENINGIDCPDHGELWTTQLDWRREGEKLILEGTLPSFGLSYRREMWLRPDAACLELYYRISNPTAQPREFLWKLHAALAVQAGDIIECPARTARVVDLASSRCKTLAPFPWPKVEGRAVNVIPPADGTVDFFYLYDLAAGEVALSRSGTGLKFGYQFDLRVFPYVWLFASYGGFNGHYTVILEPCTAMPISVKDAARLKQCSSLAPGQSIETKVVLHAAA
jgi:Domain of unknown function (DUF5107)